MTRVAVLSDIHGVLPALEAVLAEPDVRSADVVALTGDLLAGPQPVETLELLTGLGDRALWIRGNADREVVALATGRAAENPWPEATWAAAQLKPEDIEMLAGLPLTAQLDLDGLGRTLFCHATPRSDDEVVLVDSPIERWNQVYAGLAAEVRTVVCGHTHMQFVRYVNRRLVLNPGSIGMPYGAPGPHWALLDRGVQLRLTEIDLDAAADRIVAESGYQNVRSWVDEYVRHNASDTEALAAFTPRTKD